MKPHRMLHIIVNVLCVSAMLLSSVAIAGVKTIKLGTLSPTNGPYMAMGMAIGNGLKIWCEDFNKRGGITIDGVTYNFEGVQYDNGNWTPSATLKSLQQGWRQDGIRVWFVAGHNITTPSISQWVLQQDEPGIIFAWGVSAALLPRYTNVISMNMWPAFLAQLLYWYGQQHPGAKVALMVQDAAFTLDCQAWQRIGAIAGGLKIANETKFDTNTTDWRSVMEPVVASKPDLIFQGVGGAAVNAYVMAAAKKLGYTGDWVMAQLTYKTAVNIVPEAYFQGVINSFPDFDMPGKTPLERYCHRLYVQFNRRYPDTWVGDATNMFYLASVFETGLRLANSVDWEKVLKTMLATDPLPVLNLGDISWSGKEIWGANRLVGIPWPVATQQGDKIHIIDYVNWDELYRKNIQVIRNVFEELGVPYSR